MYKYVCTQCERFGFSTEPIIFMPDRKCGVDDCSGQLVPFVKLDKLIKEISMITKASERLVEDKMIDALEYLRSSVTCEHCGRHVSKCEEARHENI